MTRQRMERRNEPGNLSSTLIQASKREWLHTRNKMTIMMPLSESVNGSVNGLKISKEEVVYELISQE